MSRFFSGLLFSFAFMVLTAAPSAAVSGDAHAMLLAAAEEAAAHAGERYAFTLDHWSEENGEEIVLTLRYDPRLPKGEQWRAVGVEKDALDKKSRKLLKKYQKGEANDSMLVYDKLGGLIDGASLREETESYAEFVAPFYEEDMPEDMQGALEAVIRLEKPGGYISRIDMRSIRPFKPAAVAKIKMMSQSQVYTAPSGDGPAMLASTESAARGKAMFKKFASQSRVKISDIEKIDAAEIPQKDAN